MYNIATALTAAAQIEDLLSETSLDMEGFTSISDVFSVLTEKVRKVFKVLKNEHSTADLNIPVMPGRLVEVMKEIGYSGTSNTVVSKVSGTTVGALEYSTLLTSQLGELHDIEQRLYVPVNVWTASILNDPELMGKPWITRELKFVSMKGLIKDMRKMSEPVKGVRSEDSSAPFSTVYKNADQLTKAYETIMKLHGLLASFDLVTLKATEKRLVENLDKLMDLIDDGGITEWNGTTQKLVGKALSSMAVETEWTTMILFQANLAVQSWNETIEKLTISHLE